MEEAEVSMKHAHDISSSLARKEKELEVERSAGKEREKEIKGYLCH